MCLKEVQCSCGCCQSFSGSVELSTLVYSQLQVSPAGFIWGVISTPLSSSSSSSSAETQAACRIPLGSSALL